jgi:hypothetical protein
MVADGSADLQKRPKIALVRSDNPPALIRHVRDLIEVAADSAARSRRYIRTSRAGSEVTAAVSPSCDGAAQSAAFTNCRSQIDSAIRR